MGNNKPSKKASRQQKSQLTEKTNSRMGNLYADYSSGKGVMPRVYKELNEIKCPKIHNLIKMGNREYTSKSITNEKEQMANKTILNIFSHY